MKRLLPVLGAIFLPLLCLAQIKYENISSEKLGESRQIKIQLPRNYEENTDKTYPVLLVLDGDYLFEPVAGMVDYYSYWEDIPEMIVVGVNQDGIRMEDTKYSKQDFLPVDKGAKFFEFLGMELLAHIDQKYRTGNFKIIMGHDFTSNFINYYLLKENPIFRGYINLSPDLAPGMADHIVNSLSKSETRSWYYMATSDEDIPTLKKAILAFNNQLKGIDNKNLHYKFEEFENTSHYTLVGKAIPSAIADIFSIYRPISQKDFNETLLQTSISPTQFLTEKYQSIEDLYGVRKKIRLNDFLAVYQAIEKTRNWEEFKPLYKMAFDNFPGTMLGTFFEARYEEETGNPKRAMRIYQNAYGQQKIAFIDTDFMLAKADAIKKDFGY
ncbi:MAG: alpha/beta hydrolase-fold protein [Bacteroidota bacterium]|uniref:Putative esterase n=1 Tax=Christiangramia flava JLT2011 TaxID=1229726 RepID=A0A1L7I5N1_9FLAO|nr:alpha/beta hydrolase-fold protein [Christiangramia flava]APU68425.1 Putative esterase [Christiangramia flava JLT2011]MAM19007.1 esterase [Christiangramia sp.]MEE2772227.1 alpha/beta hydrolase-fold protein [Bacteroidota bacterium]OSS40787.1 putative esterase [Christiangramia flava JLT2011]